ncbi:glycosyltransferase family 2 protein [Microbacterium profundi]
MIPTDVTVTAVIPTIGRPELREAVDSVLAQTRHLVEVIVCADTASELDLPDDDRITVIRTGPRAGGNVARMAGIRAAKGNVVALLDDDDSWTPDKLAKQVEAVRTLTRTDSEPLWLSTSLVVEPSGRLWPERLHRAGERLPDYLFRKTRIRAGQGAMHTSTLVFPKSLVAHVPFDETLRFHQDTDWLVRVDRDVPGIPVVQVREGLTRLGTGGGSVSRGINPVESLHWARRSLKHVDRQTRGDFLITVTYFQALRRKDIRAAAKVLAAAFSWGPPRWRTIPSIVLLPLKFAIHGEKL